MSEYRRLISSNQNFLRENAAVSLDDGSRTRFVQCADGRTLATASFGNPEGVPVILFHGSPGSRIGPVPVDADLEGINLITFDRPGYGHSDRNKGRSVNDVLIEVSAIVDSFDIDNFTVVGRSGGGKFALATAALLQDRVKKAIIFGSFTPPNIVDIERTAGMNESNKKMLKDTDEESAIEEIINHAKTAQNDRDLYAFPPELRHEDRMDIEAVHGLAQALPLSYEEALRQGPGGWIDDILAGGRNWGFELTDITAPVHIYHGTRDHYVPFQHGERLAELIPHAELFSNSGSHFSSFQLLPEALNWLKQ